MVSVLAIKPAEDDGAATASPKSAFAYFLTATGVSGICLLLFLLLLARHSIPLRAASTLSSSSVSSAPHKSVSMWALLKKLRFFSFAIWLCFAVTMTFPVFTQAILSVSPSSPSSSASTTTSSRLLQPDVFIPLGFLVWNTGDFAGRLLCAWPRAQLTKPIPLAIAAVIRIIFVPLFFLCNVKGQGAVVHSDAFYWLLQLAFGLSNGWVSSNCMMAAPAYVDEDEKEACGGFMGESLRRLLSMGARERGRGRDRGEKERRRKRG